MADGELVQFNIIEGSKGLEAADITGVNGGPVQGSEYARPIGDRPDRSESRTRASSNPRQQRQQRVAPRSASGNVQQSRGMPQRGQQRGGGSGSGGGSGGNNNGGSKPMAGQRRQQNSSGSGYQGGGGGGYSQGGPRGGQMQQPQQYGETGNYAYFNNNRQSLLWLL